MPANLRNIDRNTPMLLPCDLRDWIPEDDIVHFILEAVNRVNSSLFHINHRGTGSKQYPPKVMLALLIYCYTNGVFSSRKIEIATYRDIAVRYITGNTHPDHDTIARFRRNNFDAVAECFVEVLEMAKELKLLKVGTVSVDGSKIKANASKDKNIGYDRANEITEQLELDVQELMSKAESQDEEDDDKGDKLPKELKRRQDLKKKLEEATKRIEERAKNRAIAEREEYDRKVKAREARKGMDKGKFIKEPSDKPKGTDRDNLTDPDSRLMRKNKSSGFEQAYNCQIVVDADGSQLVMGTKISQCGSDRRELAEVIATIPDNVGNPNIVLADNGYANGKDVKKLEDEGKDVYVSVHKEESHWKCKYEFRPQDKVSSSPESRPRELPWIKEMRKKMKSEKGRQIYGKRKTTVEPVFGIIKHALGFKQFLLRGVEKVSGEWQLVNLSYNLKRLWNMKKSAQTA